MRRPIGRRVLEGVTTVYPAGAKVFDIALTLVLIPLLLPVAMMVALAVALDSPGPVLFRSSRVGRDGRVFQMVKFRTMRHDRPGPRITSANDGRYTPLGRLLAISRLDELPQLWNVLRGEMRLVGPRPELEHFVLGQPDAYKTVLTAPPGLTGPTQLAFADEGRVLERAEDPERVYATALLPEKVTLDLRYVATASRWVDAAVLARTWIVPLRRLVTATGDHPRSARKAGLAMARATLLVCATVAMVTMFAIQSSSGL